MTQPRFMRATIITLLVMASMFLVDIATGANDPVENRAYATASSFPQMDLLLEILRTYGPGVTILAWFLYRDYAREKVSLRRENDLAQRIRNLEDGQREALIQLVMANTSSMNNFVDAVRSRPCLTGVDVSGKGRQ